MSPDNGEPILSGDYGSALVSRFAGSCFICGGRYVVGETIFWSRRLGAWHAGCELTPAILGKLPGKPPETAATMHGQIVALERDRAELRARVELLERELADALEDRLVTREQPKRGAARRLDS